LRSLYYEILSGLASAMNSPALSNSRSVNPQTLDQLAQHLREHSIPIDSWAQGDSKALEQLFVEVEAKETRLILENGKLYRQIALVSLEVRHLSENGEDLCLYEDRQEFGDGRVRCRDLGGDSGVSEKIVADESPELACIRAMKEELGFVAQATPRYLGIRHEQRLSSSYPGLMTKYTIHDFSVSLAEAEFSPQGYVEHGETLVSSGQISLNTYFRWRKIS
jgi:hypothetical protein